jgi:hypothetical protein
MLWGEWKQPARTYNVGRNEDAVSHTMMEVRQRSQINYKPSSTESVKCGGTLTTCIKQ